MTLRLFGDEYVSLVRQRVFSVAKQRRRFNKERNFFNIADANEMYQCLLRWLFCEILGETERSFSRGKAN